MFNLKKKITAVILTLLCAAAAQTAFAYEINVRMDGLTSDNNEYVKFRKVAPVQLDSRTLVPARDMAESAGMEVVWDQPTQTAILLLKPDNGSQKPIERYAAKLIDKVTAPMPNLSPVDITAALKLDSAVAVIRYNFIDGDGDYVSVGKEYNLTSKTILVDDGTLMLPLRDSMEIFGLEVDWKQSEMCAYVSLPKFVADPGSLAIIAANGEGEYAPSYDNTREYISYSYSDIENGGDGLSYAFEGEGNKGEYKYLGSFKITHYCPCEICNGGWGDNTAWAGKITPGQTIGVNPDVIPPLSWVYIEGYGLRRAEDTGSGIGTNHIDMAVANHQQVLDGEVVYRDVYLVSTP